MSQAIPATLLLNRDVLDNPYPLYRRLQQEAPVWRVPGTEIFIVTSYALLEEAARRVDDFSSNMHYVLYRDENGLPARLPHGGDLIQVLATADPPAHTLHRHAVFPELVAKRMAQMAPQVEKVANACFDRALELRSIDFMTEVGNLVPITIISQLIGFHDSPIDELLQTAFNSSAIVGGALTRMQILEYAKRNAHTSKWIGMQLASASSEGDTIMAAIKRAIDSNALSESEGHGILHILLSAGGETTTSLLGNAVRILAQTPALQEKIRAQPELISVFMEEVLRLESPFRCMTRYAPNDTVLGNTSIPADSTVLLFWAAGNRDPNAFKNPESLDLDRAVRHMTFGRGIHTCVGAPLARLEGLTVLKLLLARTSAIALDVDNPPQWVESLQVRRHERLAVKLAPK